MKKMLRPPFVKDVRPFCHALAVVVLTLCWGKSASAQLVLYDNFDAGRINPAKWVGEQLTYDVLEALREIVSVPGMPEDKQLHLYEIAYGVTTNNSGSTGGEFGLSFPDPSAVNAISFTLVVNKFKLVDCKTNTASPTLSGAEFRGSFFSIDASPINSNDDVQAFISIGYGGYCGNGCVQANVSEVNGTQLGNQALGTVALGSTNTLFLQSDQPNHQFIFQLNNGSQVFLPYTVPDTSPPFYPTKNIDLARVVPDCTSTPQPYALVDADFGNVYVNQ